MNTVTLFSETQMLPGLHVTLLSMLRALKPGEGENTRIVLYLDAVAPREQELLRITHQICHKGSLLELVNYNPRSPTGRDLLHGNATCYGRIGLPHLLPNESRCVYLDCDLIVNRSIHDIFKHFDDKHILLVDGNGRRECALERDLLEFAGLDLAGPCFNSGVMGLNLALWREQDVDRLIEFSAEKYNGMFESADQALLNVALHASFKPIGGEFNTKLTPASPTCSMHEAKIYHFLGSPKPWDFLGSYASNHFHAWETIYHDTALAKKCYLRYSTLKRALMISKSSIKAMRMKKQSSSAPRSQRYSG